MHALDEARIRASFVNASRRERGDALLPDLSDLSWDRLDYLGWRDPKQPLLGYVVAELDDGPVGVLLRQAERTPRARAQCSWCEDVRLPNEVVFFAARRAGAAGRRGDTLGTLVCSGFECSTNVRRMPPLAYEGFDREAEIARRIASLQQRVRDFAERVRAD
ncbi:FBP domain-containing protein [Pseudolysinimonas sp.]|uniref:FBP domain-containing protein n=1 Tax=Pseudolysinimonas sp. TaxID=2680009 RepID=UPI003F81D611